MKPGAQIIFLAVLLLTVTGLARADTFGSLVVVSPVTVTRIYQGTGPTYVRFTGADMPGCISNGGYLKPTWAGANGGSVDHDTANKMLSLLLYAKSQDLQMEVRFRVNDNPTGWNSCSIDGIWLF